MREIKFRCFDTEANEMFYTVGVSPDGKATVYSDDYYCLAVQAGYSKENLEDLRAYEIYEPKHILMQYTGLKDKNGKEIYDGDIIKEPDTPNREITFIDGGFMITMDDGRRYLPNMGRREVIGNIFENPELLTNTK